MMTVPPSNTDICNPITVKTGIRHFERRALKQQPSHGVFRPGGSYIILLNTSSIIVRVTRMIPPVNWRLKPPLAQQTLTGSPDIGSDLYQFIGETNPTIWQDKSLPVYRWRIRDRQHQYRYCTGHIVTQESCRIAESKPIVSPKNVPIINAIILSSSVTGNAASTSSSTGSLEYSDLPNPMNCAA